MNLGNLLSISIASFGDGFGAAKLNLAWIYQFISWLISISKDIGLGIILFTLALRLVTLPLDIISRASMRKNSLKMEMMKPELEKLQKQYANDKNLYQQKMMALYKKNGYSAFSACLPTIITLVFFIIVLNGFQSFSRYTNKEVFNDMARAYTASIESNVDGEIIKNDDYNPDAYTLNLNYVLKENECESVFKGYSEEFNDDEKVYRIDKAEFLKRNDIIGRYNLGEYFTNLAAAGETPVYDDYNYDNVTLISTVYGDVHKALIGSLSDELKASMKTDGIISSDEETIKNLTEFYSKVGDDVKKYFKNTAADGQAPTYAINLKVYLDDNAELADKFEEEANKTVSEKAVLAIGNEYRVNVIEAKASEAAKDAYYENRSHSKVAFWVKNIWVVDSPFSRAIPTYKEFVSEMQNKPENIGSLSEDAYNKLTSKLTDEMQTGFGKGNGYFVLVALSILSMLLSTIIAQKTQKTQMELSTVDGANGTAAMSQKMMTWIMPVMFGVFAFIYSAAFSLYMITSTLLSTLSTVLINYFVEKSFKNKIEKEEAERAEKRRYGKRR